MQEIQLHLITTDKIQLPGAAVKNIDVYMLRLDKIHPLISGNKWFKLRFYLDEAIRQKKKKIVTFGGAWSNHIIATAAACQLHNLQCIGIIRGEQPAKLSDILKKAGELGMQLIFISRNDYSKGNIPPEITSDDNLIIPAGGYGETGKKGAATILDNCRDKNRFTHICCAVGTGTMMAGLSVAASSSQKIIGISVLKNNFQLEQDVKLLAGNEGNVLSILHDYHFGGYAKSTPELFSFMNNWYRQTQIPIDFVYTGKLCYAVTDLANNNYFPAGSRILIIHSGGLTGNSSLKKGTLIF